MLFYLYNYIFNYYSDYNLDKNIINIKNNLKKTITLKKKFYTPSLIELKNKIFFRELKYKHKININDLIQTKNNLTSI